MKLFHLLFVIFCNFVLSMLQSSSLRIIFLTTKFFSSSGTFFEKNDERYFFIKAILLNSDSCYNFRSSIKSFNGAIACCSTYSPCHYVDMCRKIIKFKRFSVLLQSG